MHLVDASTFFHVSGSPDEPRTWFHRSHDYRAFLRVLRESIAGHPVRLISYIILPDHWHLIVGTTDPKALRAWAAGVITTHTARIQVRPRRQPMRPYPAAVAVEPLANAAAVVRRCRDVERRALAAGLSRRTEDWPWCSATERYRLLHQTPLTDAPYLGSQAWMDYLNRRRASDTRFDDLAKSPGRFTDLLQSPDHPIRIGRRADENQAHTHVERAEHLGLVDAAVPLQPLKQRRHAPTLTVQAKAQTVRQHAR
jgi:putative transposase